MKKNILILLCSTFLILFINSCKKKDLPAPDPLASQKTAVIPPSLDAPCKDSLVKNQVSLSTYFDGYSKLNLNVNLYNSFDYAQITCLHYLSENEIDLKLPLVSSSFIGKVKYAFVYNYTTQDPLATMIHRVNDPFSYYSDYSYVAYDGYLYAEYTKTNTILSFCDVKVRESSNSTTYHTLKGQIVTGR